MCFIQASIPDQTIEFNANFHSCSNMVEFWILWVNNTNKACKSKYLCVSCNGPHTNLLLENSEAKSFMTDTARICLYPTTEVMVGKKTIIALFHNCANANFVSEELVTKLKLATKPTKMFTLLLIILLVLGIRQMLNYIIFKWSHDSEDGRVLG